MEIKSGKMVKSFEFFSKAFSFWSNLIQSLPDVCSASQKKRSDLRFLRSLLITYLVTLSLENEIIVLEPKICTVISQKFLTLQASTFISMCLFTVVKCENIYQIHYKSK